MWTNAMRALVDVRQAGMVLLALLGAVMLAPATARAQTVHWTQRVVGGPSARHTMCLAYDSARQVVVGFGGFSVNGLSGETWEWNGGAWSLRATTGPSPRSNTHMVYDSARGVSVLFGGLNGVSLGDTWEWNGTMWTERTTQEPSPSPRNDAALAYDSARGVTVLFGGGSSAGINNETWEWNGATWSLRTEVGPSARSTHVMAYDSVRGVTVLFGGSTGAFTDETWEWNGTTWTQRQTFGPSARYAHAMAFDSARGVTVLFGGYNNFLGGALGDTWEWNGVVWTQVTGTGPSSRLGHRMAYDSVRGKAVLFGGGNSAVTDETWELGGYSAVWTGAAGNGNWHAPSNWSPPTVPGSSDDVLIPTGSGSVQISAGDVAVQSVDLNRPLSIAINASLSTNSSDVFSMITNGGTLSGTYTLRGAGVITFPTVGGCATGVVLDNVTINGNLSLEADRKIRWQNSVVNGTINISDAGTRTIYFSGDQIFQGTMNVDTSATLSLEPWGGDPRGLLTIAPGSVIQGGNVQFSPCSCGGCVGPTVFSVLNLGTLDATVPNRSIAVNVPFSNFGTVLGAVSLNGGPFGVPFEMASPNDNATVAGSRPLPGVPGPPVSFEFNSFTVLPGGLFGLGSNETLILNGGMGTLFISEGGVFYGNGVIIGNLFNSGLLIIPITRAGLINVTFSPPSGQGGVVMIETPHSPTPQPPIYIPTSAPPVVNAGTFCAIGGSGFGGTNGGSSGGGGGGGGGGGPNWPGWNQCDCLDNEGGGLAWDGRLDVTGSFTQTSTGFLRMFIAGDVQGETYSFLNVGTTAAVEGTLQVVLEPTYFDYLPRVGNTFDLIHADGGLTLPSGNIAVQTLLTEAGAAALGISLPLYDSGFAADPNRLVLLPENLFQYSIVDDAGGGGGQTLRVTMTLPVCAPTINPVPAFTCPIGSVMFGVTARGSGPFAYQWQAQLAGSTEWLDVSDGPVPSVGTVTGAATRTLGVQRTNPFDPAGTLFRCVVSSDCGAIPSSGAALTLCPVDLTCDGAVTSQDFFEFLVGFFNGTGDFNRDGVSDSQDLFDFLGVFFVGC